ncbi:hypothetical protein [uncultured Sphingomonas sp.]|uniref:hypothetical protein n=1 Tax=uncultured Sphingomonas sp. TaxID=158754 RepID=UPI0025F417CF|nr:hypothetical protein [uncultured Sphingomonas sp.]
MTWLSTGAATTRNGSTRVTFTGVDLIANAVEAGDAFGLLGGFKEEIGRIVSATEMDLARAWLGPSADNAAYAIQPTTDYQRAIVQRAGGILTDFRTIADTVGQGMFPDGNVAAPGIRFAADRDTGMRRAASDTIALVTGGVDRATIDSAGTFLVGTNVPAFGTCHTIDKAAARGNGVAVVQSAATGSKSAVFLAVDSEGWNGAPAAAWFGKDVATGRGIAVGGTGNFNGSDYAEYMTKADDCGAILKGDVCGVDRNGRLTRTWADASRYVVKSTDPSLVGGDTWATHLPPKPEEPDPAQADWAAANDAYQIALPAWEAEFEKARRCVDRIAFSGQVPVNVDADTLAACKASLAEGVAVYLVAIARGAGIGVVAVREGDMTLPQYMRRVGCVWAIRNGRPWVDVQHG